VITKTATALPVVRRSKIKGNQKTQTGYSLPRFAVHNHPLANRGSLIIPFLHQSTKP
jgi:hypothetical protein